LDLNQNLSSSIDYSKKLFADLGQLLILIVLDVIPIVNLVVVGYMTRVIKEPPSSDELPPLTDYASLWIQGLKVGVAGFIYLLIPFILIAPFIFLTVLAGLVSPRLVPVGLVLAIPMLLIGLLLMFFILIIMSMGIVNMVKKDNFAKAFAFGEIVAIIRRIGWGTYILWTIIIFVCSLIVGGIVSIPAFGWVISLVISPIIGVFVARSTSLIYSEGTVPAVAPIITKPPTPPTGETKFCTNCGAEIAKEALYCKNCGNKQEA
jgi:hypothetical protein